MKKKILFLCTGFFHEGGFGPPRRFARGDYPSASDVAPLGLPQFPVQE